MVRRSPRLQPSSRHHRVQRVYHGALKLEEVEAVEEVQQAAVDLLRSPMSHLLNTPSFLGVEEDLEGVDIARRARWLPYHSLCQVFYGECWR